MPRAHLTAIAICTLATASSAETILPGGTYESNFGNLAVECVNQFLCMGKNLDRDAYLYLYPLGDGTGRNYSGFWAEAEGENTAAEDVCADRRYFPHVVTRDWGKVVFEFDPSGGQWSGVWEFCDKEPEDSWDGTRISAEIPIDAFQVPGATARPAAQQDTIENDTNNDLLGSWRMISSTQPDASREVLTFSPDGVFTLFDGNAGNTVGTWQFEGEQLSIDGRLAPVTITENLLTIDGMRLEPFSLQQASYEGIELAESVGDPAGVYRPQSRIEIGDYVLDFLRLDWPGQFRAFSSGIPDVISPVQLELSGGDQTVLLEASSYLIEEGRIKVSGTDANWGRFYVNADFYTNRIGPEPEPGPAITGDVMIKGHIFRDVSFSFEPAG